MKFIATSVAAEVVVVLEDQNPRVRTGMAAVEVSCGEAADPAADDHEIVGFASALRLGGRVPKRTVAELMRDFKRAGMTPAKSGESGRLVARVARSNSLLEKWILRRAIGTLILSEQTRARDKRCADGDRNAVQKIPACDLAEHS